MKYQQNHGQPTQVNAQGQHVVQPRKKTREETIEDYAYNLFEVSSQRYDDLCVIIGDSMMALMRREEELDGAQAAYVEVFDAVMASTNFSEVLGDGYTPEMVNSWVVNHLTQRDDTARLLGVMEVARKSIRNHKRIIKVQRSYLPELHSRMQFATASLESIAQD